MNTRALQGSRSSVVGSSARNSRQSTFVPAAPGLLKSAKPDISGLAARKMTVHQRGMEIKETVASSRRWQFGDPQEKAKKKVEAPAKPATELFVMLPMDIIEVGELKEGQEVSFIKSPSHDASVLDKRLSVLKRAGVTGLMLDVWWGICERKGPKEYDFSAYMQLFKKARKHGLKIQAVASFHAGGGNVGDGSCDIPLPPWVIEAGEAVGDEIFYTDKGGGRDHECLSLGCDHEPVLWGRTPLQAYADYLAEFARQCKLEGLWGNVVTEICVGTGPCGELRYPAYQEKGGQWSYFGQVLGGNGDIQIQRGIPGIGEFQCYDKYMLADLKKAAEAAGHPEWGNPPREGAGSYDFVPWETEFFALTKGAGWESEYGHFFMEWYSNTLVKHGGAVLDQVIPVIRADQREGQPAVDIAIKVAGIHWWYKSRSHAAEMTAGYYNHIERDGYEPVIKALKERDVGLSFTCIEMSDDENPDTRHCSPEGLVRQVVHTSEYYGIQVLAENALEGGLYNQASLDIMHKNAKHFQRITLLRMNPWMFVADDAAPEKLKVKEPLAGFLAKFKRDDEGPLIPNTVTWSQTMEERNGQDAIAEAVEQARAAAS